MIKEIENLYGNQIVRIPEAKNGYQIIQVINEDLGYYFSPDYTYGTLISLVDKDDLKVGQIGGTFKYKARVTKDTWIPEGSNIEYLPGVRMYNINGRLVPKDSLAYKIKANTHLYIRLPLIFATMSVIGYILL
jgi:hypothetical protein